MNSDLLEVIFFTYSTPLCLAVVLVVGVLVEVVVGAVVEVVVVAFVVCTAILTDDRAASSSSGAFPDPSSLSSPEPSNLAQCNVCTRTPIITTTKMISRILIDSIKISKSNWNTIKVIARDVYSVYDVF